MRGNEFGGAVERNSLGAYLGSRLPSDRICRTKVLTFLLKYEKTEPLRFTLAFRGVSSMELTLKDSTFLW